MGSGVGGGTGCAFIALLEEIVLNPEGQPVHEDGHDDHDQHQLQCLVGLHPANQKLGHCIQGLIGQKFEGEQDGLAHHHDDVPDDELHHPSEMIDSASGNKYIINRFFVDISSGFIPLEFEFSLVSCEYVLMYSSSYSMMSQQLPDRNCSQRPAITTASNSRSTPQQNSTPTVLSSTLVVKYQMQASLESRVDNIREISTLMKWANSCDTPCFEVSIAQMRHGRFGDSRYRLKTSTLKDRAPSTSCTSTPATPNIQQDMGYSSDILYIIIGMKNSAWSKGPNNHIVCEPPHDRPIFCLATGQNTFVTGSADHGLREYNMQTGKHVRQLFAKKYGHKEWVSTCAYTPSGHVLSGGMDSLVCYWDSKAVRCDHFEGHGGSISKVMGNDRIGISSSYDATIILWDLAKRTDCQKLIGPHKQAVMTFQWHESLLVSGDKSGVVGIWDLNSGQLVRAIKTHKGAVNKIVFDPKNQLIHSIGLNDGSLASLDMRSNQGVFKKMLHKGATNDIKLLNNKIVTCSADNTVSILQAREFKPLNLIDIKQMAFALESAGDIIVAATSGGNIVTVDSNTGEILFGYGVMKKGQCRLLGINRDRSRLVCAGEDDSPSLLCF